MKVNNRKKCLIYFREKILPNIKFEEEEYKDNECRILHSYRGSHFLGRSYRNEEDKEDYKHLSYEIASRRSIISIYKWVIRNLKDYSQYIVSAVGNKKDLQNEKSYQFTRDLIHFMDNQVNYEYQEIQKRLERYYKPKDDTKNEENK